MAAAPPLVSATLATAVLVAALAAPGLAAPDDRMTICHKPADGGGRTMELARSAWSGHKGHGDHEGACGQRAGGTSSRGGTTTTPPPRPLPLALTAEHDGDLDGDASVRLIMANHGEAAAKGLRLAGTLRGDDNWSVQPPAGMACTLKGRELACTLAELRAGADLSVPLAFDGRVTACGQAGYDVRLTADNDATRGDDRANAWVAVGACSPLDGGGAAA